MRVIRTSLVLAFAFVLVQSAAQAGLTTTLDPANLHINGPGGFAQGSGGTDWVTLPTFNGDFNITDVANNGEIVSPWHLVIAVPNVTSGLLDQITKIGTTTLGTPISNDGETTLLAGQDAYVQLGVPGSGLPNSLSFTNFALADATVAGLATPTAYGLFDFTISASTLAILANGVADDVQLSGLLPAGSILFAWGVDQNGTTISTAFTNAGVITPAAVTPTPQPSSLVMAGTGAVALLVCGLQRKLKKVRRVAMA
jgi:hypothetical protein